MANSKTQDVPFMIDGNLIVKTITKSTTCRDVISKLPTLPVSLAVFESVDGQEKELSGKAKLLKIWRAHGPTKRVVFVVRKSQLAGEKTGGKRRVFGGARKCDQSGVKSAHGATRDRLKQISDLAFYVRYQKKKISALSKKSRDINEKTEGEPTRLMNRFISSASRDSMDSFLNRADLEKMAEFLGFCSNVTNGELQKTSRKSTDADRTVVNSNTERRQMLTPVKSKSNIVEESLRRGKLGFKPRFVSQSADEKPAQRTSTGTLSSTDTGYNSVGSASSSSADLAKKHTFFDLPTDDMPRHSTPVSAAVGDRRKRAAVDLDNTFNSEQFDETKGKDMILQKFMADQTAMSVGCYEPDAKKPRTDRHSMPVFSTQSEKCRYLWDKYCDSDSDSSSICDSEPSLDSSALDNAFLNSVAADNDAACAPEKKTLRRESAISDLNKIIFSGNTLENYYIEEGGFDYSFDCSFQRFDASETLDFSCSFDESDCEDGLVDSFMKTRRESDLLRDVTFKLAGYESDQDEGVGSLSGSGSVSDSGPELVI